MTINTETNINLRAEIDSISTKANRIMLEAYMIAMHADTDPKVQELAAIMHGLAWDIVFITNEARFDCEPQPRPWE